MVIIFKFVSFGDAYFVYSLELYIFMNYLQMTFVCSFSSSLRDCVCMLGGLYNMY